MTTKLPSSAACQPESNKPLFAGLLLALRDVMKFQRRLDEKVVRLQTRPLPESLEQ